MAKIILVSKHVTPTSWQLAKSLKSQQHEVVLLTSYGEFPEDETNGIQLMSYFKRWNFVEGLRIIPGLFGLHPQILHLVLDEDRINPAQVLLSAFAKSHPTCVLTTSLLNIHYGLNRRNPVRYLIEESDIVTCPTVDGLGQLRGLNIKSLKQGRGILPPALTAKHSEKFDYDPQDEEALLKRVANTDYVLVPFQEKKFSPSSAAFKRLRTIAEKYQIVLWGSYSHWSLRDRKRFAVWMEQSGRPLKWVITGELSNSTTLELLKGSKALILAGQNMTPAEMTEYYVKAIQSQAVIVLDSRQSSVHADLWKNGVNCWVLDAEHLGEELQRLLQRPHLRLPEKLVEDRSIMDSSMNELNRLYNRALNQLR